MSEGLLSVVSYILYGRKGLGEHLKNKIKNKLFFIKAKRLGMTECRTLRISGDTAFVFGGGESINLLSNNDWSEITKRGKTVAVNMTCIHDFAFDVIFWEAGPSYEMTKLFFRAIKNLKSSVIINASHYFAYGYQRKSGTTINTCKSTYFYNPLKLRQKSITSEGFKVDYNMCSDRAHSSEVIHHCTNVGAAVDFLKIKGFKNIVLVGVDLNGGGNFTQSDFSNSKYGVNPLYKEHNSILEHYNKTQGYDKNLHPSMISDNDKFDAYNYFKVISEVYNESGVKLFVMNSNSKLSDFLDVYEMHKI